MAKFKVFVEINGKLFLFADRVTPPFTVTDWGIEIPNVI